MRPDHVFISYRRDDAAGYARAVYDALAQRFGAERVFSLRWGVHRYRGRRVGEQLRLTMQTEGGASPHTPVTFTARKVAATDRLLERRPTE